MHIAAKIAMALIGQALPSSPPLSSVLSELRLTLITAVISAILVAAMVLSSVYGLHYYMVSSGATETSALVMSLVVLFAFGIGSLLYAQRSFDKALQKMAATQKTRSPEKILSDLSLTPYLQAFVDGFKQAEEAPQTHTTTVVEPKVDMTLVKSRYSQPL